MSKPLPIGALLSERAALRAEVERLTTELAEARCCIQVVRERVEGVLENWMRPPGGQEAGVPDKSISPQTCRELLRYLTTEQGSYTYEEWCKVSAEVDRLRERLDQYEAYAISVASALDDRAEVERLRAELENERRTVAALTPAANYCLEYKPLLLKAEAEVARLRAALEEIEAWLSVYEGPGRGMRLKARAALEEVKE